jgi:hypothetical protein
MTVSGIGTTTAGRDTKKILIYPPISCIDQPIACGSLRGPRP